jgi:hypothetical protein
LDRPAGIFQRDDRPSITVNRTVESNWGISGFHIYFDEATINPGGASQGNIGFAAPDGQRYVQTYQGALQMEKALKGRAGAKKAIILYLNGHGFKYYYEWRE